MAIKLAIGLCALACVSAACSSNPSAPPAPTPVTTCTPSTTMTFVPFRSGPSPNEGTPFVQFFASLVIPVQGGLYFVDVTTTPVGCFTPWTAVASNVNAVNVSPFAGNGRGQVELFMTQNTGPVRQTTVTIAGQAVTILQAGR